VLAGMVTALAVTIRPNLVPLAAVVGTAVLIDGDRQTRFARAAAFVLGLLPGPLAVALIQWHLYGSPLVSGYGQLGSMFDLANIAPNAANYGSWLLQYEWPIVCLGLVGAAASLRAHPAHLAHPTHLATTLFTLNLSLYLAYLQFDDWSYLRFLLPGLAVLSACAAAFTARALARLPGRLAPAACAALVCLAALHGQHQAQALDVFGPKRDSHRFLQTATYVNQAVPKDAVLFCMEHSGSLRYYTHRTIVRYDFIEVRWLDRAVAQLQAIGRPVYFVVDDWEIYKLRERFAGRSTVGLLDWRPEMVIRAPGRVTILRAPEVQSAK
jgi:hypothetical protein